MSVGTIYIADNGRVQQQNIQHELVSLGAIWYLITPQLSAGPLGGAVGAPVKSLLSGFRFKL